MAAEIIYPVRINKYLALKNICSRKEADRFIASGQVKINNCTAVLGDKVLETDEVRVHRNITKNRELVYLAFNKPKGVVTHSPQAGEKSIADIFNFPQKLFPVGRLDKDSYGLIILTNDGRITDKLLSPEQYHEKEYQVKVDQKITPGFITQMTSGVVLDDGYQTRPCQVKKIDNFSFSIILTEGKKRQIRRMCEILGRKVQDLRRDRIMNIKLNDLKSGEYRKIKGKELEDFLQAIGVFIPNLKTY